MRSGSSYARAATVDQSSAAAAIEMKDAMIARKFVARPAPLSAAQKASSASSVRSNAAGVARSNGDAPRVAPAPARSRPSSRLASVAARDAGRCR